jgi:hypothetical protein
VVDDDDVELLTPKGAAAMAGRHGTYQVTEILSTGS